MSDAVLTASSSSLSLSIPLPIAGAAGGAAGSGGPKDKDKEKEQAVNELNFENLRLAILDLQGEFGPAAVPVLNKVVELVTSFEIARDYHMEKLGREMKGQNRFKVRPMPCSALSRPPRRSSLSSLSYPFPFFVASSSGSFAFALSFYDVING